MSINVAIDGPAGAGKSTIAKNVAAKMNYIYVDTGAMYRSLALYFIRQGIDKDDESNISAACKDCDVTIDYVDGQQQVILNGENVTGLIRTEEVGNMASASSVYKDVRAKLLELQRRLAKSNDVIMDGRDIGTCILPDAQVKVFLTASVDTRADRRYKELIEKNQKPDLEKIKKDIEERDYRDSHRENAPLKQADDAVLVDSSDMSIEEVTNKIIDIINSKI
ncbi:MAG: (d)CMP kinase [Lachnospiraceae bacterium]|nr:(d)CMP kinase [Lachnospiraceae bacterium]